MIETAYKQTLEMFDQWVKEGVRPLEIAAVLVTVGLSLYRTLLSPQDYEAMIDEISSKRHDIKILNPDQEQVH